MNNRKVEFRLDEAKMLNIGNGNITNFCELYGIDKNLMYHVKGKSYVKTGTKSQKLVARLISLGVAKYENIDKENDVNETTEDLNDK